MTAHEDHPELIVFDEGLAEDFIYGHPERPLTSEKLREVRRERQARPLAPDRIDRAAACGGEQPGRWVLRDAVRGPISECRDERFLDDVLGQREVLGSEEPDEDGDQAA